MHVSCTFSLTRPRDQPVKGHKSRPHLMPQCTQGRDALIVEGTPRRDFVVVGDGDGPRQAVHGAGDHDQRLFDGGATRARADASQRGDGLGLPGDGLRTAHLLQL